MNAKINIRAIYVTIVDIGQANNEGSIVCRQHIERLAKLSNLDLSLCLIGSVDTLVAGEKFAASLGCKCHAIPFGDSYIPKLSNWDPATRWPFSTEKAALATSRVNTKFKALCKSLKPEIVIIDYLFTALFIQSVFEMNTRRILITLNRETDFFSQLRQLGRLPTDVSQSWVANLRLRLFENWTHAQSTAVVALTPADLPKRHAGRPDMVIRPVLNPRKPRWRDTGSDELFFVGNISHYPNFLAISWLCEQFAPELAKCKSSAKIRIIGAEPEAVPEKWIQPNVAFGGIGTKEQVLEGLTTSALFIAPIQNNYGSKIKVLESLAHGTPTLGTLEAYSGLDIHKGLPTFRLDDPLKAAQLATTLLSDRVRLADLSGQTMKIIDRMESLGKASWKDLISSVMRKPPRKCRPSRFALSSPSWGATSASLETHRKIDLISHEIANATIKGLYNPEYYRRRFLRWTNGNACLCKKTCFP